MLPFQITNYQAVMVKYNFTNCNKLTAFNEHLPHDCWEQFQSIVAEGQLLARMVLQPSLDAGDTAARSIPMAGIMRRTCRLQHSGFPREVQNTVEDFPFDGHKFFSETVNDSAHISGLHGYPSFLGHLYAYEQKAFQ